ncbi:MAG: alkaline phosphatase D family protein [Geodermatophilaceae bacterium]|nr:alkaline phosphatase D family protein [Geodermatophilaceae bacterium]
MTVIEQQLSDEWSRRRFLGAVGGVAALAGLAQVPLAKGALASPAPPSGNYPFSLGVASGDPAADGFVLWTRLAPEPFAPRGGGMPSQPVAVDYQVATDEAMTHVVRRGIAPALPQLAHSVHVEPTGLLPDREYWYQFRYGDHVSPVGRTKTTPALGAKVSRLSFAFASCQSWSSGYYSAYRHLAAEDLDLVVHLGDYVYEGGIPADGGYRKTPVPLQLRPNCRGLDRWRLQYALYKSDPDLQRAHARFPWIVTWDDHEVQNDYASETSQYEGDISQLRANAYQAYYEHQPLRVSAIPRPQEMRLYRRLHYGDLVQFDVLDGRQYRSVPPCGWGEAPACAAAYHPSVTMLGQRQEDWLLDGLATSSARWNVLANNVMMGRLDHDGPTGDILWHDAWDGFPAARTRITDHFVDAEVRNPVIITGDWHSTFVNDIKRNFDLPRSPVVATEFVGTSISSNGDDIVYGPYYGPMIKFNPHIQFFDGDRRGYVRCTVSDSQWRTDLRMVETVSRPNSPGYTFASFVVEDGVPGAQRI